MAFAPYITVFNNNKTVSESDGNWSKCSRVILQLWSWRWVWVTREDRYYWKENARNLYNHLGTIALICSPDSKNEEFVAFVFSISATYPI